MPELPEVETVRRKLKKEILNKRIVDVKITYEKVIENIDHIEFINKVTNQYVLDINRIGKWLIFELSDYYLLSHLRMEGKYVISELNSDFNKHEHISFVFDDFELRYADTRKFGRMQLFNKDELKNSKSLNKLGKEPWDLDSTYLKSKLNSNKHIKTLLLDQSIIAGLGNIYDDEVLFDAKINPLKLGSELNDLEIQNIINSSKKILNKSIELGGTTIRTYQSLGEEGTYQNELKVHTKTVCQTCGSNIEKIKINGRSTYYCPKCQVSSKKG